MLRTPHKASQNNKSMLDFDRGKIPPMFVYGVQDCEFHRRLLHAINLARDGHLPPAHYCYYGGLRSTTASSRAKESAKDLSRWRHGRSRPQGLATPLHLIPYVVLPVVVLVLHAQVILHRCIDITPIRLRSCILNFSWLQQRKRCASLVYRNCLNNLVIHHLP